MGLLDLVAGPLSGPWLYVLLAPALIFGVLVSARRKIVQDLDVLQRVRTLKMDPERVFERQIRRSLYISMKLAYGWPFFVPPAIVALSTVAILVLAAGLETAIAIGRWPLFAILCLTMVLYLAFMGFGFFLARSKGIKDYEEFLAWQDSKQEARKPPRSKPKSRDGAA